MTDRDAFVRAILQNPADDTPRLVFADWLDENGEPERAEFIRVQCELARGWAGELGSGCVCRAVEDKFHCRRCMAWDESEALRDVERRTFDRSQHEPGETGWLTLPHTWSLPGHYTGTGGNLAIVRRGFVDEVRLPLATFLEHAESLFRNHPITRVVLTDVQPAPVLPEMGWGFERLAGRRGWQDHELPDEIWSRLPLGDFANPRRRWYRTRERADDCLSDTCVVYGRERAGLPAL